MIDRAVAMLTARDALDSAPYLAVLGPRGSGKTRYLELLEGELRKRADGLLEVVSLDLRQIAFCGEAEEHERLYSLLQGALPAPQLAMRGKLAPECAPLDRVDELILRLLSRHSGVVVLLVDSLDVVSPHFARALSQRLRRYREEREINGYYRRLAVVLAGAVSLYTIRNDADSVMAVSRTVSLPAREHAARAEWVRRRGAELSIALSDEALSLLADATGGEPAFMEPILAAMVTGRQPNGQPPQVAMDSAGVVEFFLNDSDRLIASMPILEEILLASFADSHLRDIVKRLLEGGTVRPTQMVTDIDPYQLMGPVVLMRTGGQLQYEFRNSIVAHIFGWYDTQKRATPSFAFCASEQALAEVDAELAGPRAGGLGAPMLGRAFRAICGDEARLNGFYLYGGGQQASLLLSLGGDRAEVATGTEADVRAAAERSLQTKEATVLCGQTVLVAAVPLSIGEVTTVVLLAKLERSALPAELSSLRLLLWTKWVGSRRPVLDSLALAEVGRCLLVERGKREGRPVEDTRPAEHPSPSREDLARQLAARQARRTLRGLAVVVLLAAAFGAWHAAAYVSSQWPVIEPMAWLFSTVSSLLVLLFGILGFPGREWLSRTVYAKVSGWCERRILRDTDAET